MSYIVLFFQSAGNLVGTSVLRVDRHVVTRLCRRRALPRLASLPRLERVRPAALHLAHTGHSSRPPPQRRHQVDALLLARHQRRQVTSVLAHQDAARVREVAERYVERGEEVHLQPTRRDGEGMIWDCFPFPVKEMFFFTSPTFQSLKFTF